MRPRPRARVHNHIQLSETKTIRQCTRPKCAAVQREQLHIPDAVRRALQRLPHEDHLAHDARVPVLGHRDAAVRAAAGRHRSEAHNGEGE